MQGYIFTFLSVLTLGIGVVVIVYGFRRIRSTRVENRMSKFVVEDSVEQQRTRQRGIISEIRRTELEGSFFDRTVRSFIDKILDFLSRRTPANTVEEINNKLEIAGNPMGMDARGFLGIQLVMFVLGTGGAIYLLGRGPGILNTLFSILFVAVAILLPLGWLQSRIRTRQDEVLKDFPEAVEILSICTNAGLSFNQAMMRYSELSRSVMGREFARVVNEMEVGLSRQEALRAMADRLDIDEVSSFVSIIVQSEQLGMSISSTLSALAEQMRTERYFRVKEEVQRIPIKMLFPLAFLIFPALIAIILGPSLPPLLDLFRTM